MNLEAVEPEVVLRHVSRAVKQSLQVMGLCQVQTTDGISRTFCKLANSKRTEAVRNNCSCSSKWGKS